MDKRFNIHDWQAKQRLTEEGDKKIPKAGLGGFSAGPGPRTPLDPNLYKKSQGNNSFGSAGTDKRSGQVIGDILQLIKSTGIDPEEVIEAIKMSDNSKNYGLPKMDPDTWGFRNPKTGEYNK